MIINFLNFFNLERDPFQEAVDPDFFYLTEFHEQTILKLNTGLAQRRPIMMLWGRSGMGKTMLSRLFLSQLDQLHFLPLLILPSPQLGQSALLDLFCHQLDGPTGRQASRQEKLFWLRERITREAENGRQTVCLVDEAHFLRSECLHLIRSLSNWESSWGKLLTIIFIGEPPFLRRLRHPAHAAVRGRISLTLELPPLSEEETEQLIKFRLLVARGRPDIFTPDCYPVIHRASQGIPRLITKIAGNALLEGYCRQAARITPEITNNAIAESG
ncbi:MAG: AAA family ATPase [Deltaproteobacteria bacterium]|nr:AAA family ATPase [Deltaproteobacteria bacterium]